jgi:predicted ATP-binding protein involved in virulence
MKIKKIIIENFKFHHHLEFEIRNNNNCLIYGENGSEKVQFMKHYTQISIITKIKK